jgi:hypothetical protein
MSESRITVLNPACSSTMVERVPLAPRKFTRLDNKTIFMIDIGWGGPTAGYDIFTIMEEWFRKNIPSAKTVLVRKKGSFAEDDPQLWKKIKSEGDAAILGISC